MAASGESVVTNAKVGQTSKPTADKFFKDFFADVDFNGARGSSCSTGSVGSDSDWLHVVNRARLTNLLKKRPENSKIFNWIERYVAETEKTHPEFIRALVTIICRNAAEGQGDVHSSHIDTKIIKQRVPVLQRYINNNPPLELHALYAAQAFNHSLHNPPGLLRILFCVLYEKDVCSEKSFYDWKVRQKKAITSQKNPGKDTEYIHEPEVLKESARSREIVLDVNTMSSGETTQPEEDKRITEKTDDAQSDVVKRRNEKESVVHVVVVSKKKAEVAVVPDTTPAKQEAKEEKSDTTGDREDGNETNNVESKNSKSKKGTKQSQKNKIQLKYSYRENQWSPVNPEGKKQYDRDFLLQFQKGCTVKPVGLPNIPDIVLDRAVIQPLSLNIPQGGNQKSSDFMPHFMKSPRVQVKGGKQPNYPTGQGRRSSREPLKVIQRARDSVETKLLTSDEAWKPGFKQGPEETADDEAVKTQELLLNFTSILNKLTPQLFTKLADKALQLPIDTEERLKGVISLVFEKALSDHEPNYSTSYALMCQKLSQLEVQSTTTPGTQVRFRPILVHNCQQEFEKEKQTEIDEAQRRKEIAQLPASQQEAELELLQEKIFKARRRIMVNIRFIGELYKLRILTENIMHNYIMKLLKAKDDESLECLCGLMSKIGKDLDHEKVKNRMDQYFSKIDKIIASQKNAPRIRFLMYDLVDLRKNNWVPRRQESKPTTIDALHKEWHIAEAKSNNGPSRSREQAPPPRTVTPQADDGWNTVPTTNKTRTAYDPSKLKLTKMTVDDNIQLGPGGRGFSTWGRVSIGASNKNQSPSDSVASSQEDAAPPQANRLSMLSEDANRPVSRGGSSGSYGSRDRDSRGGRGLAVSIKRPSREREIEAAIAEVQRISRGRPSRPEQPDPRGSQEKVAPRVEKREEPTMTDAKVKQTSKATVDEYLNLRDFSDPIQNQDNPVKEGKPNPNDQKMQLKYAYREDQWSLVNPEGKKQYDRDFLLQFQKECMDKPDGLPNIPDIILDRLRQMPQPVYPVRHQNPTQIQGIQQHPQAGGPAAQQGANTAQIMQSNAAAAASGQYMQQGQPQYIISGAMPIVQQMGHRPFHQQSNPHVYQATTPPYYSSQLVWLNPATQPTPRQQFTSQPPAARPDSQQQRKKTIIRILDPTTNQDVTETIMRDISESGSPHSGRSSANVTPPVSTTSTEDAKRIHAQFAAKVAMVASDLPQSDIPPQPHRVVTPVQQPTRQTQTQQPPQQPAVPQPMP